MASKKLSEFALIERLKAFGGVPGGNLLLSIGDDCAAWRVPPGHVQIITTDTLVEGVHFDLDEAVPGEAGWKALAASVSDIAAMGARPTYALVSLSGPARIWGSEKTLEIYRGMKPLADRHGIRIVGGNLTRSPEGLSICVTLAGEMPEKSLLRRSGARPGDYIFVTGVPGRAAMWRALRNNSRASREVKELFRLVHYHPEPPVEFGQRLSGQSGGHRLATAAIDISDGLLADLCHVLKASGISGATVDTRLFPVSVAHMLFRSEADTRASAGGGRFGIHQYALTGGEDYELLFTAPPSAGRRIAAAASSCGVRVTRIGEITGGGRLKVVDSRGREYLHKGSGGWTHF